MWQAFLNIYFNIDWEGIQPEQSQTFDGCKHSVVPPICMLFLFSIPCDGKKVNTENAKITGMTSCEAQLKGFSVQQCFKNAAEVWASSPHLRSK